MAVAHDRSARRRPRAWKTAAALLVAVLGSGAVVLVATCREAPDNGRWLVQTSESTPVTHTESNPMNRLQKSRSLYLRQHARNPVAWQPWDDEALRQARALDRPIFLSIGYASCHWCHVMEGEVFEDPEVAALLNARFVSIKVDREERPDLDATYMAATQAMTGGGGWPMSLFLTPDLKPFFAGTYVPRDRFVTLLRAVDEAWRERRDEIERTAGRVTEALARALGPEPGPGLDLEAVTGAATRVLSRLDTTWGGLEGPMKFPMAPLWAWMLHVYRKTGDERFSTGLRVTLDAMASGGMRDPIGGGFHRYATDPRWIVPHFEKMLYDNALLAGLYLEAARVFGEPRYAEVAQDTLMFLLREMRDPSGAFCASLDADDERGEGAYYRWTPEEVIEVLGPTEGPVAAAALGITGIGEDGTIPTLRASPPEVGRRFAMTAGEVEDLVGRAKATLFEARGRRPRPVLDPKVVASWNGLAISAFARAGAVLAEPRFLAAAVEASDRIWAVHRHGTALLRSSYDGHAEHDGVLEDYAMLGLGFAEAFQASGEARLLERAVSMADEALSRFPAPEGGFFTEGPSLDAPLGRRLDLFDHPTPSGNAAMITLLVRLGALTGRSRYTEAADRTLRAFSGLVRRAGADMASWLDAGLMRIGPFYDVVIAGDPDDPETGALVQTFWETAPPHAVLTRLPREGAPPALRVLSPSLDGKVALHGRPTAYVCLQGRCKAPTSEPAELRDLLGEGWAR